MFDNRVNCSQRGLSMLEVLVALVIFAVGLLAIASLQGSLLRSGADAKIRTVATGLAQEKLEELRAFGALQGAGDTYENISEGVETGIDDVGDLYGDTAGNDSLGASYTREWSVDNCYFDEDGGNLACGDEYEGSKSYPDFKRVSVEVTWEDASGETNAVTVEDAIGAMAPGDSVGTVGGLNPQDSPEVDYKLIAATEDITRVPVLEVDDDEGNTTYQETWRLEEDTWMGKEVRRIEAIHYTNSPEENFRSVTSREEAFAVACNCDFDSSIEEGSAPTVWDGAGYLRGVDLEKPAGVGPGNNDEDILCNRCCQDHHDSSSTYDHDGDSDTEEIFTGFDAFRQAGGVFSSPHQHFNDGDLSTSVDSGSYVEACRFIRNDGFFEVARDFYMVDVKIITDDEVDTYSDYAATYVEEFLIELTENQDLDYPNELPDKSNFSDEFKTLEEELDEPVSGSADVQTQAIYIDYLDPVLVNFLLCRNGEGSNCEDLGVDEGPVLQSMPFQVIDVTQFANFSDCWFEEQNAPPHVDLPDGADSTDVFRAHEATVGRSNSTLAVGGQPIDPDDRDNLARDWRRTSESGTDGLPECGTF